MSEEREAEQTVSVPAPAGEEHQSGVQESPQWPDPMVRSSSVEKIIDDWFNDHIRNSPISRHTPSASHMNDAIAALKARLQGLKG